VGAAAASLDWWRGALYQVPFAASILRHQAQMWVMVLRITRLVRASWGDEPVRR